MTKKLILILMIAFIHSSCDPIREGIFTLLFRKKEGKWVVVYDHAA